MNSVRDEIASKYHDECGNHCSCQRQSLSAPVCLYGEIEIDILFIAKSAGDAVRDATWGIGKLPGIEKQVLWIVSFRQAGVVAAD